MLRGTGSGRVRAPCSRYGFVRGAAGFSALAIVLAAPLARAQSDEDRAGARSLAVEGAQAYQAQRWADAIDLFSRAESLVHAPPHLLYIARASVQAGQLVRARETYMRIVRESIAPNAPAAFRDAQEAAKSELPALEPRIPTLTIKVKGTGTNLAVSVDGKPVPPALIGAARPTDPGEHKLQASADGMASEVVTVSLKESAHETAVLELIPGKTAPAPVAEAPPEKGAAPSNEMPAPSEPEETKTSSMRWASYGALGVGVVGLGVGTLFALKSKSSRSDADDLCPDPDRCPVRYRSKVESLDDDARSAKTLAIVGFAAGGVGLAAGVTLFLLSGNKQEQAPAAQGLHVTPWIGFRSAGVSGAF